MAFELHAGFTSAIATDPADTAAGYLTPDRYNLAHVVTGADVGGIPHCPTATTIATSANFTYAASAGEGLFVGAGTATTDLNAFRLTQTMNAAAVAFTGSKWTFTEGASGTAAGTLLFNMLYGTSGAESRKFSVDKTGVGTFAANISFTYAALNSQVHIIPRADGVLELSDSAQTNFGRLQFGGTTSSFPSIKRNSAAIDFRLADDSAYATIAANTIELGHASDTTLSRSAAGVLAVEGVVIPSISSTNTLTNKRITKRTGTTTSHATPTINTDNVDAYFITAQTEAITSFTTNLSGTPTEGQGLLISITGTAARAITWGTSFEASTVALPTTTVSTNRLDVAFIWNSVTSKWRCTGSA